MGGWKTKVGLILQGIVKLVETLWPETAQAASGVAGALVNLLDHGSWLLTYWGIAHKVEKAGLLKMAGGTVLGRGGFVKARALGILGALLLVLSIVTACGSAGPRPIVMSGEILDATGKQFVTTAGMYNKLLDDKLITADQYRPWATFAREFQRYYPPAVETWQAFKAHPEAQEFSEIASLISDLKTRLTAFFLEMVYRGKESVAATPVPASMRLAPKGGK